MSPAATSVGSMSLQIENVLDHENIHQRCLLVKGYVQGYVSTAEKTCDSFITVRTSDERGKTTFPTQTWPLVHGQFKALVMLEPGFNCLFFCVGDGLLDSRECVSKSLPVNYVPLLQNPPLHLAILVGRDSPLTIDCPPAKHGAISSAHSSLEAAIAKFRMTAYMWQALTAEDMRSKALGRRAFRIEEEWTKDTTSKEFVTAAHEGDLTVSGAMRSTAKIHLIKSKKSCRELRDANIAQQNESARRKNDLFDFFLDALKEHGLPFESSAQPIVAGLILDSHYSMSQNLILGHAALGCHNAKGISLGMFGSHLTYSWPRFVEEVPLCLSDHRCPGDTVGNDNNECNTLWEACSIGQGAFLHEVGHAFGAPHTSGIMARGYSGHWPRNFLVESDANLNPSTHEGYVLIQDTKENEAKWDLRDALAFQHFPHFWIPGDDRLTADERCIAPGVTVSMEDDKIYLNISIDHRVGLQRVQFNDIDETVSGRRRDPEYEFKYSRAELEQRFDPNEPLKVYVLAKNGKEKTAKNVWKLLRRSNCVRIAGSSQVLMKRSVMAKYLEEGDDDEEEEFWTWATLLRHRQKNGKTMYATSVDIRTGCILDGAYVKFGGEKVVSCGPRVDAKGDEHHFGGHAAQELSIPNGRYITCVEVSRDEQNLLGLRVHLDDGTTGGALSGWTANPETCMLVPEPGHSIVGFFGRSKWPLYGYSVMAEFGILTAPSDYELPTAAYGMSELQNTDGGIHS